MSLGNTVKMTVFGQSHSEEIGVIIEGIEKNTEIDIDIIRQFLLRRAPGRNEYSSPRKEPDEPVIISGLDGNKTNGEPLKIVIRNTDKRATDYENTRFVPRPSHADYAAFVKYGKESFVSGGGFFSGRMTAPMVIAGAVACFALKKMGIEIGAHIYSIADIHDKAFDSVNVSPNELIKIRSKTFPVTDDSAGEKMREAIISAKRQGDSLGGVVECAVSNLPAGIGSPIFNGIESEISRAVFSIPAVKGIEFGSGFHGSSLRGSENNDPFDIKDGKVITVTNNHGGILGGISSGMPIIFRASFKPTPSISIPQQSVNLLTHEREILTVSGRHDPCIVPRAVPVIEAVTAFVIYDMIETEKRNEH